jgi:hypothetical protein
MTPRPLPVVFVVLAFLSSGCIGDGAGDGATPSLAEIACGMPRPHLVRMLRGFDPARSGEIQFAAREPNLLGASRPHSGPWAYVQEVPIFLYGPGHVPEVGPVEDEATVADIAPTLAAHLRFDLRGVDGRVLEPAVPSAGEPPRLVVVVVWDGAGRNVLERHPDAWPVLRSLIPHGTWFDRATVGSSPSVTPAVHATLGSGLFPTRHGLVDLRLRIGEEVVAATDLGPRFLRRSSLADRYDAALGNRPLVGTVALDEWHLAMSGRGADHPGGDRDLAALWDTREVRSGWVLPRPERSAFTLPSSLAEVPGLGREVRRLDEEDGVLEGLWLGEHPLREATDLLVTPAYGRWQTTSLATLIEEEGFGADAIPDLLFTNYKQIDLVGHRFGMETPEMEEVVRSTDQALAELIDILDREVGAGRWVLALTADHGSAPPPAETGAHVIDRDRLKADLEAAFDDTDRTKLVEAPRVTQFWLDVDELRANGHTLEEVARFLLGYTRADNAADPAAVPEDRRGDRLFAAALPGSVLERGLPCLEAS